MTNVTLTIEDYDYANQVADRIYSESRRQGLYAGGAVGELNRRAERVYFADQRVFHLDHHASVKGLRVFVHFTGVEYWTGGDTDPFEVRIIAKALSIELLGAV